MTVKIDFDPVKGIVTKDVADGDEALNIPGNMNPSGISPFKQNVRAVTADATLSTDDAGIVTVSGSSAVTVTLPAAAGAAGVMYTVRTLSVHAHVVTASGESNGTLAITDGTDNGSSLALFAGVGSSAAIQCDGVNWLVLGNSGSLTIDGT